MNIFHNIYFCYTFLIILFLLIGYLLGSLNFSIILSKFFFKNDIRKFGSYNAGATNANRVYGKYFSLLVGLCDVTKTFFALSIAVFIEHIIANYGADNTFTIPSLFLVAGLGSGLGHCFPLYYNFKGGKGVVTFFTTIGFFNIYFCIFLLLFLILFYFLTKYMGISSVLGCSCAIYNIAFNLKNNEFFPEYSFFGSDSPIVENLIVFLFIFLIIIRHQKNIRFYFSWLMSNEFSFFYKPIKFKKLYLSTDKLIDTLKKKINAPIKKNEYIDPFVNVNQNIEKNIINKEKYITKFTFKIKKAINYIFKLINTFLIVAFYKVKKSVFWLKKRNFFKNILIKKEKKNIKKVSETNNEFDKKEVEDIEKKAELNESESTKVDESLEINPEKEVEDIEKVSEGKVDDEQKQVVETKKVAEVDEKIKTYNEVDDLKDKKLNEGGTETENYQKGFQREQEFFTPWEKFKKTIKEIFNN
ncbi:glycerol-3-phosphate acyltransferase [symbiont of Argiope bruennichi]|uniref:glycerol-3-phosphate acyltransferase n=1 Tax=symbiont of Argiope bruennichi TaxID=2810479 RepID=UPI003DA54BF1